MNSSRHHHKALLSVISLQEQVAFSFPNVAGDYVESDVLSEDLIMRCLGCCRCFTCFVSAVVAACWARDLSSSTNCAEEIIRWELKPVLV